MRLILFTKTYIILTVLSANKTIFAIFQFAIIICLLKINLKLKINFSNHLQITILIRVINFDNQT